MAHGLEIALQRSEQVALGAALEDLAQKGAPLGQHLARELEGGLGLIHGDHVDHLLSASCVSEPAALRQAIVDSNAIDPVTGACALAPK